ELNPNTNYTYTHNTDYMRWYMNKLLDDGSTQLWKFNSNGGSEIVTFETDDHTEYQLSINTWSQNVSLDRKLWNLKLEKGNIATDWSPAPEDYEIQLKQTNKNLKDVSNTLSNFKSEVNTTFKDGIIEEAEAKSIKTLKAQLSKEKKDIDQKYETIYGNLK